MNTTKTLHISLLQGLPVIGDKYLVNCVKTSWKGIWENCWMPVIHKKPHEDYKALGPNARHHYHYDFRFLDQRLLQWLVDEDSIREKRGNYFRFVIPQAAVAEGPKPFELECLRQMPDYPDSGVGLEISRRIQEHYTNDLNVKTNCLRCPHRGTPLNGIEAKNNVLTCPAHGLKFNAETGKQIDLYDYPYSSD